MAFSDPKRNIDQFGIVEGARVADFGCGSGFYTIAAAKKVGPDGRVYAIDIQQDLLTRVSQEAVSEEIENIDVVWGDLEQPGGTHLADGAVNVVLAANILFQIQNKKGFFAECFRVLKPGGRILVVDWSDSFGGLGPHQEDIVSEFTAREGLEKAGFEIITNIDAGAHHYGVVGQKPKQ